MVEEDDRFPLLDDIVLAERPIHPLDLHTASVLRKIGHQLVEGIEDLAPGDWILEQLSGEGPVTVKEQILANAISASIVCMMLAAGYTITTCLLELLG